MSAASNHVQEAAFRASEGRFRVLLGTFDGATFLDAQLASLHSQSVATLDVDTSGNWRGFSFCDSLCAMICGGHFGCRVNGVSGSLRIV